NVKRSHESTSVEESKKLHASRGNGNERDADRNNVKRSHESTSVEESKKLHASRGDENERDADRSAFNEAGNSRKKKKCQDEKATGN
ncbi:hypothetical protein pdam_00024728, partial [Pocillopora damicornis]